MKLSNSVRRKVLILAVVLMLSACNVPIPTLPPTATPLPMPTISITATPAAYTGVELAWSTSLGAEINWAPALVHVDDRTLLIVASEAGSVVALDPISGDKVWQFTPPDQLWTDSVTVVGDAVFVAAADAQVFLLEGLDGAVRWQTSIQPPDGSAVAGLEARSKPTLSDGVLYIPSAGIGSRAKVINPQINAPFIALKYETGAELWRFASGDYILRAPFVDSKAGRVYVGGNYLPETDIEEGGGMRIHALTLADGKTEWTFESLDGLVKSVWASQDVVAYVAYRDFLVGLDTTDGEEMYRHNTGNWVQSFAVFETPPDDDSDAILVYGSANAFLNAVNPADGEFVWRHNIEGAFNYPIGNAVLIDDTVYFVTQRGDIQSLNAVNGSLLWQNATELETRDGIAAGMDHIFLGSVDGSVYGYRLR